MFIRTYCNNCMKSRYRCRCVSIDQDKGIHIEHRKNHMVLKHDGVDIAEVVSFEIVEPMGVPPIAINFEAADFISMPLIGREWRMVIRGVKWN